VITAQGVSIYLDAGKDFDIDGMSSGEKGLILTFLIISQSIKRGGIILLDEPELHLNPAVCRLLLPFLVEKYLAPFSVQALKHPLIFYLMIPMQ